MKTAWLLIFSLAFCASSARGQRRQPGGPIGQHTTVPTRSEPSSTANPARTPSPNTQGILIDMTSNLGRGIEAELTQEYKEAIKLLTRAIEEEHGEAIKLALAHRFRGL